MYPHGCHGLQLIVTINFSVLFQELAKKCQQSMEIIVSAKDRQAAEANKIASILLEELDKERESQEKKRAVAAKKREKKRQKKKEKQEKEKDPTTT